MTICLIPPRFERFPKPVQMRLPHMRGPGGNNRAEWRKLVRAWHQWQIAPVAAFPHQPLIFRGFSALIQRATDALLDRRNRLNYDLRSEAGGWLTEMAARWPVLLKKVR